MILYRKAKIKDLNLKMISKKILIEQELMTLL